LERKKRRSRL